MAIYIDADKLKQDLADLYDFGKWDPREIHFSLFDMVGNIDGEPTADVAPVVHAHWIDYLPGTQDVRMICSNCATVDAPMYKWKFCPNCGAKMDEVSE